MRQHEPPHGERDHDRAPYALQERDDPTVGWPGKRTLTQSLAAPRAQQRAGAGLDPNETLRQLALNGGVAGGVSDVLQWIYDNAPTVVDPLAPVFGVVVETNRAGATLLPVPQLYKDALREYLVDVPSDSTILRTAATALSPHFYSGGWILDVQQGAHAMTLDRAVFVRSSTLDLDTWVHELVHVWQYFIFGRTNFLTSFFGLSAATLAKRLIRREPLEPFNSSPHEAGAYGVEGRFRDWAKKKRPDLQNYFYEW